MSSLTKSEEKPTRWLRTENFTIDQKGKGFIIILKDIATGKDIEYPIYDAEGLNTYYFVHKGTNVFFHWFL
jgi:hypothetical protein